jgi:hypothetical protein
MTKQHNTSDAGTEYPSVAPGFTAVLLNLKFPV